jgi:hypothetical protein
MTAAAIELSGHPGLVAVPAEALDELAARVGGRLLRPGDPAVRFARDHGAAWASRAAATTSPGPPSPRAA